MKIVIHPEFADVSDFVRQLPQSFEREGELLYESRNVVKRLTHSKALCYIVIQYATLRGWNPRECTLEVFRYLLQFEQKRKRKRKLQS